MGFRWLAISFWFVALIGLSGCEEGDIDEKQVVPATAVPALGIASFSVTENIPTQFLFTLSTPLTTTTSFTWTISSIAAPTAGRFSSLSANATFPVSATTLQVPIPVINDSIYQPDQDFTLTLSNATAGVSVPVRSITFRLINDDLVPSVIQVTSSAANGSYGIGAVVPVTVGFTEAVTVTGSPQLSLNTGRTINYVSGSGTANLNFSYTVQVGDVASALDALSGSALSTNGGTIKSVATAIDAILSVPVLSAAGSLATNKSIVIDTVIPTVTNVTSTTANGSYKAGSVIAVTATFSKAVTVSGTPFLTLATGTTNRNATYASGSGTPTLTLNYTVQAGDSSTDLDQLSSAALSANGGTIRDIALNDANLTLPVGSGSLATNKAIVIDTLAPTVTGVSSSLANGAYTTGQVIPVVVSFSEPVFVSSVPTIALQTRTVNYSSGTGTSALTFNYTVQAGDTAARLDYLSTSALSGAITDLATNSAVLTLAAPAALTSLGANKNLIVDTTAPSAPSTIDDGTWTTTLTTAPVATWTASSDATSGISRYEYALGTSAGGNNVIDWTSNGTALARTQSSLSLTEGVFYYASARAVDVAGNISTVATGDGFRADVTAPTTPATMTDGVTSSSVTQTPPLTWAAATDALSGIANYQLAVGTTAGASNVLDWTNVGVVLSSTGLTGLTLTYGNFYYASVRVVDVAGNISVSRNGDGWMIGWLQEAYLKSVNDDSLDSFGSNVAISGDTMVVGVPFESSNSTAIVNGSTASANNSAANSGAVYVYVRSGNTWTQQAYIKASNAAANSMFGKSVAIDADTIVVGAPQESGTQSGVSTTAAALNLTSNSGAAYVYVRSGTNWSMQNYLKAASNTSNYQFGTAVAIAGNTIAVGTAFDASDASSGGSVTVFTRSAGAWTQQAYLKPSTGKSGAMFGAAVALNVDSLIVGAPGDSSDASGVTNSALTSTSTTRTDSGAAYTFKRAATTWTQEAYIKSNNNAPNLEFGSSVAIEGDTAVVGSPNEFANAGGAYVYSRTGAAWAVSVLLQAVNADGGDAFGKSVAISSSQILIGAPGERSNQTTVTQNATASLDNSMASAGAAYLYTFVSGSWTQLAYLKAPNVDAGDQFGSSCAISGSSFAIGAPFEDSALRTITNGQTASSDNSSSNSGAAYIFNR